MRENLLMLISGSVFFIIITIEIVLSHLQLKKFYTLKDTVINFFFCGTNMFVDLLFRGIYVFVLFFFYQYKILDFSNQPVLYWFLLFIFEDLMFYIEHSVDHYCRIFWAVHVTHHSSEFFNLTTGIRSSVFQPIYRFIYFVPLALMGFKPIDIMFMYSATQIYGILIHTQYIDKMPAWFESIFVSPSHHRVHHGSNVLYLDKNMGMALIIWDKMFGTFQEEIPEIKVHYGLKTPVKEPYHPVKSIFHEWTSLFNIFKSNISLTNKLKYLFMPPGWSHDGSTKTAKQLRNEEINSETRHSEYNMVS